MKKEVVKLVPYSCDGCGRVFGTYDNNEFEFVEVEELGSYTINIGDGCVFEGRLDGDYCHECMSLIKGDYRNSVIRERYDAPDLDSEIAKVKQLVKERRKR